MNLPTSPPAHNGSGGRAGSHHRPGPRAANGLLDNPIFRRHTPLRLQWSDEQLSAITDKVRPLLAGEPTDRMVLAAASIIRSIALEERATGRGVHYARGKDLYNIPARYRAGDRLFTWHLVTKAMDLLASAGLIKHHLGAWAYGRQSVAYATDELMALVGSHIDVSEGRALEARSEMIALRDSAGKKLLDYLDTIATEAMRRDVLRINESLTDLRIVHRGRRLRTPIIRRIFNGSFERGGRLYFQGTSVQNMSADDRLDLEVVVEGELRPVVEIDYRALHINMAYAEAGVSMPTGDPYSIDGFDRAAVKLAVNVLFNARSRRSAVGAVARNLDGPVSVLLAQNPAASGDSIRDLAETLVSAVEHKHSRINPLFGSDCGARFQRLDSDIAVDVMLRMLEQTGRCPLPLHDSFIVADVDADLLRLTMTTVAREHGLELEVKEHRAVHTIFEDLLQARSPLVLPPARQPVPSRCCGSTHSSISPLAGNSPDLHKRRPISRIYASRHDTCGVHIDVLDTITRTEPPRRAPRAIGSCGRPVRSPHVNALAAHPP